MENKANFIDSTQDRHPVKYSSMVCHPVKYSSILYKTSWVYLIASLVGFYNKKYDLAIYTGLGWLTSINYWKNPDCSWCYNLDILTVRTGITYHLIRAVDCPNYMTFYNIFNSGLLCYIPSRYLCNKKQYFSSTIFHAATHLITGIGLIYLYLNDVKPFSQSYIFSYI